MNTLGKTIAIFVGMVVVFAVLLVAANSVTDKLDQIAMVGVGSAVFGSGLTFFMIRIAGLDDRK